MESGNWKKIDLFLGDAFIFRVSRFIMVRRDKNIPWEVIIRKFKCEISEKEQAELDVWLADVENHARFQSWQSLWLSIMEENMRYVSNVDALWKRMEERMRKAEPRMFKLSLRSFRLYIAAVAVLFFLLFSFAGYMTAEWYKASDAVLAYSSLMENPGYVCRTVLSFG